MPAAAETGSAHASSAKRRIALAALAFLGLVAAAAAAIIGTHGRTWGKVRDDARLPGCLVIMCSSACVGERVTRDSKGSKMGVEGGPSACLPACLGTSIGPM